MADVPFLGCKISLISKCDIRYEGILYCVDAKESTIALSKVRSYGTETRGDPSHYVAPKNDVYDIIIFRASDVKDLRVDAPEPPGLSDPAIISAHHSYSGQSPSTSSFNNINSNTATSSSATNPSTTATSTTAAATTTNNLSSGLASALNTNGSLNSNSSGPSNQQKQQQHQKPLLPFLPTGSSNNNTNNKDQQPINYSSAVANNAQRRARQQEPRDNNKRSSDDNNKNKQQQVVHENNRRDRNDRRREDGDRNERRNDRRGDGDRRIDHDSRPGDGGRRGGSERRDDGGGGRRGGGGGGDRPRDMRMNRSGYDRPNHNNHVNSNNMRYNNSSNNYNSRRGPSSRDNNYKGGAPMYRRGGPLQGGRRARSGDRAGSQRGHPRKGAPLKFEGDYNFDEANKIFLELEGKFKGLKLNKEGEGNAKEKDAESSGCDGVTSKSPAGQSESGSGYDSEDQNNKDGDSKDEYGESVSGEFYDRAKSFFDNISCEASERSQGKVNKPDWRKERQLNAETFGVSANYRRGGYRGRNFANGYHRR